MSERRKANPTADRQELMRKMHAAGLRLDDAATAADIALRAMREQRNTLIEIGRALGLSFRQLAMHFQLDVALIHRMLTKGDGVSTPRPLNLNAPDKP